MTAPTLTSKTCPTCDTQKPVDAFAANSARKDGLSRECKDCSRASNARYLARKRAAAGAEAAAPTMAQLKSATDAPASDADARRERITKRVHRGIAGILSGTDSADQVIADVTADEQLRAIDRLPSVENKAAIMSDAGQALLERAAADAAKARLARRNELQRLRRAAEKEARTGK